MAKNIDNINIFESDEIFDKGYLDALDAILDVIESGDGPDAGGGSGPKIFPDPRLVMPTKNGGKQGKSKNNEPMAKNKTIEIGDKREPEDSGDNQEKADNAANDAQTSASNAKAAAEIAEDNANKAAAEAEKNDSALSKKKASKAKEAASKAREAANKAEKAAEQAKQAAENGDTKGAKEAANKAKDAENEAKIAANSIKNSEEIDNMTSEEAASDARSSAEAAKQAAEEAKQLADSIPDSMDENIKNTIKKAAKMAQEAADKAENAAKRAENEANNENNVSSLEKSQEAAKEAREAAEMAKAAKNTAERAEELHQESEEDNNWGNSKMTDADKIADPESIEADLYDATEYVDAVNKQFASKLTGPLGDFLDKSRESIKDIKRIKNKEKRLAVKTYALKAKNAWDVDFKKIIDTYISGCIQEKKREMKSTYQRPNRRQGQVNTGDIIKKGRIPKKDKMDITMTFYIDISGSMYGDKVINAFKAAYAYSDFITKRNKNESIIGDFDYTYYAFNTKFYKITGRKIPQANGDNVGFNEILEYIEKHSMNDMINIIITDAEFPINPHECIDVIKRTSGLFIVIANNSHNENDFNTMKKALQEKFEFLLADTSFTFKEPTN